MDTTLAGSHSIPNPINNLATQPFWINNLGFSSTALDHILADARRMNPYALGQIHDRYYPEVYRYVHYRLEDAQVCEDIASEVFLRLLDALQKKRGLDRNLIGWLLGTASNLVNDHLRPRYARPVTTQVRQALHQLAKEQQHVLALRFTDERSLEETARITGKSVTAVKTLQFRALDSLSGLLLEERS